MESNIESTVDGDSLPTTFANSDSTMNELALLRAQNEELKKKLDQLINGQPSPSYTSDNEDPRDAIIEELKQELMRAQKDRDSLKYDLEKLTNGVPRHEPVANPLQTALVNYLLSLEVLTSRDTEEVMRSIDRGDFAPKDAYIDSPQLIGFNTTISAPHMHALQLELLKDCFKNAKVALDIGTGSGYMALALAKLMNKENIKVYGIDHIPKLIEQARENVAKHHAKYLENKIEFHLADGREGFPDYGPYDIVLVGGAVTEIPEVFIEQLSLGGSMLIPVGENMQKLTIVHKTHEGKILKTAVMSVGFGKLTSVEQQCPELDE